MSENDRVFFRICCVLLTLCKSDSECMFMWRDDSARVFIHLLKYERALVFAGVLVFFFTAMGAGTKRKQEVDGLHGQNGAKQPKQEQCGDGLDPMKDVLGALSCSLGPEFVSRRSGPGGMKLSYLKATDAIRMANHVFGNNGWCSELGDMSITVDKKDKVIVHAQVKAKVTVFWPDGSTTSHEDYGCGGGVPQKDLGPAREQAIKEAASDAVKRALRMFGEVLGNCLYDQDYLKWVEANRARLSGVSSKRQWSVDRLVRFCHGSIVVGSGSSDAVQSADSGQDSLCSNVEFDDEDFVVEDDF